MSKLLLLTSLLLVVLVSLAPPPRRMLTPPAEQGLRGLPPRRLAPDPRIPRHDSHCCRCRRRRPPRLRRNSAHELDRAPELQLQGSRRRRRGASRQQACSGSAPDRRVRARGAGLERRPPAVRQLGPPWLSRTRGGELDFVRLHGLYAGTSMSRPLHRSQ